MDGQVNRERERNGVTEEKDEVGRPLWGHKGGEWGQGLNGTEKRCDWLITVMEHVARTIGLFTSSILSVHTLLLHAPPLHEPQRCVCVSVCILLESNNSS